MRRACLQGMLHSKLLTALQMQPQQWIDVLATSNDVAATYGTLWKTLFEDSWNLIKFHFMK